MDCSDCNAVIGNLPLGAAMPAAAVLWSRAGTVLSPFNTGDTVHSSVGVVGAPSYSFVGDPNTGMYASAADEISFSTAGVARLIIDANGDVTVTGKAQYTAAGDMGLNDEAFAHKKYVDDSISSIPVLDFEFEKFESLGESYTDGIIQLDKIDATTATKPAGTYRIGFNCEATNSSNGDLFRIEFKIDGTVIHNHTVGADRLDEVPGEHNSWQPLYGVYYKTLESPATIDLNITYSSDNSIARISNAIVEIWKVS